MSIIITPSAPPQGFVNDGKWFYYAVTTPAGIQFDGYHHGTRDEAEDAALALHKRAHSIYHKGDAFGVFYTPSPKTGEAV